MRKLNRSEKWGLNKRELSQLLKTQTRSEICQERNISERTLDRIIQECHLGRNNFGSKGLNWETVLEIRQIYKTGAYKQKDLAKIFNISQSLVSKITNNQVHSYPPNLTVSGEANVRLGFKHGY